MVTLTAVISAAIVIRQMGGGTRAGILKVSFGVTFGVNFTMFIHSCGN
jgi:hypothetical protein